MDLNEAKIILKKNGYNIINEAKRTYISGNGFNISCYYNDDALPDSVFTLHINFRYNLSRDEQAKLYNVLYDKYNDVLCSECDGADATINDTDEPGIQVTRNSVYMTFIDNFETYDDSDDEAERLAKEVKVVVNSIFE